jgi:hypothetical protein
MSDYQDTEVDVVVVSDEFTSFVSGNAEEAVRARDAVSYRLRAKVDETIHVSETWIDSARSGTSDSIAVTEEIVSALHSNSGESVRASESLRHRIRVCVEETLAVTEETMDTPRGKSMESISVLEEWIGKRRVFEFVEETLTLRDHSGNRARDEVTEMLSVLDTPSGKMRSADRIIETVGITDSRDSRAGFCDNIPESLRARDEIQDFLAAVQWISDEAEVNDTFRRDADYRSQAWTANTDNWAMSRYAPCTFDSMTVIGGTLHATGPGGVYAASGAGEIVNAEIRTGKLDLGKGSLVHPAFVYLEYEKDGGDPATLEVTQTQSGQEESFSYSLPGELSGQLTNGRFTLGRGLRGRHFTFTLRYPAFRGHLNDVSIVAVPTKRRI